MLDVKIQKVLPDAIVPKKAHEDDAGFDLYTAPYDNKTFGYKEHVPPRKSMTFRTGIAMEIPKGYVGLVFARSGLGIKRGLKPRNCVGVIDSNYRGEILVCLYNDNETTWQNVEIGERIAQIVIVPYLQCNLITVDSLEETDRGNNGFGSSGQK